MKIFRITEMLVEDRHLGELLRRMAGIVRQFDKPVPVVEKSVRAVKNGGVQPTSSAGNLAERFREELSQHKGERIVVADVRAWLKQNGQAETAAAYLLSQSQKTGILRKVGTGSRPHYVPILPRAKKARAAKKKAANGGSSS